MNSKSFLLFSRLILFFAILTQTFIYPQDKYDEKKIEELKRQVYIFNEEHNISALFSTLLSILELDPDDKVSKKQLGILFKIYFDEISEQRETVNLCLQILNEPCNFPLLKLVIYFYNLKEYDSANYYLENINYCNIKIKEKDLQTIFNLNANIPFEEILNLFSTINQNSDSLIKLYSVYAVAQRIKNKEIALDELFTLFGLNRHQVRDFYLSDMDSIRSFFLSYYKNFDPEIFNRFILSIQYDSLNSFSPQKLKGNISFDNFLDYYNTNDTSYLNYFLNNYQNQKVNLIFDIKDIIKFIKLPQNQFFKPILKILLNVQPKSNDYNSIYQLTKLFFELKMIEESKKAANLASLNLVKGHNPEFFIPIIFMSYLSKQDSAFLHYTKKFFLLADKENIQKIKSELKWWNDLGLKIDYLSKLIEFFDSDISTFTSRDSLLITDSIEYTDSNSNNDYYALIIAVQDYEDDILDLKYPAKDAEDLKELLIEKYNSLKKNIIFLVNPKRSEIIQTFLKLRNRLNASDNLLIFYAGHGNWDEVAEQGYWLPSDATSNDLANVITNSEITAQIRAIKTKHTLLISDACFSGSIFKTRDAFIEQNYDIEFYQNRTARKAITSGALSPVPDKSIFIQYLLKALRENQKKFLTSEELYLIFREAVINNSPLGQRPLFGNITDTGDEGGDFIFIKD